MKTLQLFLCAAAVTLFLLPSVLNSQTAASVKWSLIPPDSQKVSAVIGNVTGETIQQFIAGADSFIIRSYSGTVAGTVGQPGSNYMRWNPGAGVNWGPETDDNPNHYVQFVAAPATGNKFTADSVSIWLCGGGTSAIRTNVYYSTNATFTPKVKVTPGDTALWLGNSGTAGADKYFAFKLGVTVNNGQKLYVRFYPYYTGAASTSKYFYTQLATIKGTTTPSTGVGGAGNGLPANFSLHQNYPNPFNPTTTISFDLPKSGYATLSVYNLLGQKIATLVSKELSAGLHEYSFDASSLNSGVYFYKLESGSYSNILKMMLLK